MNKIYLSIDLDYWIRFSNRNMLGFLNKALDLNVPVKTVESHEEILPHVNSSKANALYNMDHHSDIIDTNLSTEKEMLKNIYTSSNKFLHIKAKPSKLCEGNWVNFVKFRKNGTFLWIYPEEKCFINDGDRGTGRCDTEKSPFTKRCIDITGWKIVKRRQKKLLTAEEWKQVIRVGISFSPNWIDKEIANPSLELLKKRKAISKKLYQKMHKKFIKP